MTYTLAADGTSDRVLIPIITWSLKRHGVQSVVPQSVDFGRLPGAKNQEQKMRNALSFYPSDLLFVHRDAEAQSPEMRRAEIRAALLGSSVRHVPVIPVRMTEAWLLFDGSAIRSAAGNPNGSEDLQLPDLRRLESLPDPKKVLHDALTIASGLNSSRRSRFPVTQRVHFITNHIEDYSALDVLSSFAALQEDIRRALQSI